jgi:hypothetical protein
MKKTFKINSKILLFILTIIILSILSILLIQKKEFFQSESTIYILGEKEKYYCFEDYIDSFIDKIPNTKLILYNTLNDIPTNNNNDKFVFIFNFPDTIKGILDRFNNNSKNIYLINTEQLSRESESKRINSYPKFIKMIDYCKGNFKYYSGFTPKLIDYQINMKEIYNLPKTNDICIMANLSDYRKKIVTQIKEKGYQIDEVSGWKKQRDEKLFTYKIIVNVSYNDQYKIIEPIRCNRCIYNKMIVISEMKEDIDLYSLKDYMIFAEYDKLADKVIEVFNNYDYYYKKLGLDTLDLNTLPIDRNLDLE